MEGSVARLYKIVNDLGHGLSYLWADDLVNLALFRKKINIAGRYVWLGKIDDLMRVEEYIFRKSESAKRIRTLGWQRRDSSPMATEYSPTALSVSMK